MLAEGQATSQKAANLPSEIMPVTTTLIEDRNANSYSRVSLDDSDMVASAPSTSESAQKQVPVATGASTKLTQVLSPSVSVDVVEGGLNLSGCPTSLARQSLAMVLKVFNLPTGVHELENSPENGGGDNLRNEVLPVGGVKS